MRAGMETPSARARPMRVLSCRLKRRHVVVGVAAAHFVNVARASHVNELAVARPSSANYLGFASPFFPPSFATILARRVAQRARKAKRKMSSFRWKRVAMISPHPPRTIIPRKVGRANTRCSIRSVYVCGACVFVCGGDVHKWMFMNSRIKQASHIGRGPDEFCGKTRENSGLMACNRLAKQILPCFCPLKNAFRSHGRDSRCHDGRTLARTGKESGLVFHRLVKSTPRS